MGALLFTSVPVQDEEIQTVWGKFQDEHGIEPLKYDEWPILEGIAGWYIRNLDKDNELMVRRALAVKEYLVQQVRGREADPEYEDILADNGISILFGYCGLKNFERAKFFAQLLQMERRAGRLNDEEDYALIKQTYKQLLGIEGEKESQLNGIIKIQWDTISHQSREIESLSSRLSEAQALADASHKRQLEQLRERLEKALGSVWMKLQPDTRKFLVLGGAYLRSPLCDDYPDVPPSVLFKAVNNELNSRLLGVGRLDPLIFRRHGTEDKGPLSPVRLLTLYSNGSLQSDREAIRAALGRLGGESKIMSQLNVKKLEFMRKERNRCEHFETQGRYTSARLDYFTKEIWRSGWLVEFLRRLAAS